MLGRRSLDSELIPLDPEINRTCRVNKPVTMEPERTIDGQFILYITTMGLSVLLYRVLISSGSPVYASDGSLIQSGDDLNSEGLTA